MNRNFELSGMSCGGCVNTVKSALLKIPNITAAEVKLVPPMAILTMNSPVKLEALQAQLSKFGHYTIKESIQNRKENKKVQETRDPNSSSC